jgi:predicted 2-oxoglutarate/Fe(II)-dependent dioxygenase YbiX
LAKYTPEGTKQTQWHHDADSNMTGLINLAPELYTGGGTDIRTTLLTYDHIPSIPKGHALVFNGNMLLHRGAPVETGERYLLVFWVTTDRK